MRSRTRPLDLAGHRVEGALTQMHDATRQVERSVSRIEFQRLFRRLTASAVVRAMPSSRVTDRARPSTDMPP